MRGAEDRVARRLRVVGERLVPRPREAERRARDGRVVERRGADLARDDRAAGREDVVVRERVEDAVDRRPRRLGVGVAVEEADGGERCQDQLFGERGLRVRGDEGRRAGDENRPELGDPVRPVWKSTSELGYHAIDHGDNVASMAWDARNLIPHSPRRGPLRAVGLAEVDADVAARPAQNTADAVRDRGRRRQEERLERAVVREDVATAERRVARQRPAPLVVAIRTQYTVPGPPVVGGKVERAERGGGFRVVRVADGPALGALAPGPPGDVLRALADGPLRVRRRRPVDERGREEVDDARGVVVRPPVHAAARPEDDQRAPRRDGERERRRHGRDPVP